MISFQLEEGSSPISIISEDVIRTGGTVLMVGSRQMNCLQHMLDGYKFINWLKQKVPSEYHSKCL